MAPTATPPAPHALGSFPRTAEVLAGAPEPRRAMPSGTRVIESRASLAAPVPEELFDGRRDERWAAREVGWERVR